MTINRHRSFDDNEIDGETVRELCLDDAGSGLIISGGVVTSLLDLSWQTVPWPIEFVGTRFLDGIDCTSAITRRLRFDHCDIQDGFRANGIVVGGDLDFDGSHVRGSARSSASRNRTAAVWLSEASIEGRLLAAAATFEANTDVDPLGRAFHADHLRVRGNVRFVEGFRSQGEIRMIGSELQGSLDLTSCHLSGPVVAVDASESTIAGSLFLVPDTSGHRPIYEGRIDLSNTTVQGQFLCSHVKMEAGEPRGTRPYYWVDTKHPTAALRAPRATFNGDVRFVRGCEIAGSIDLSAATFDGQLDFADTAIEMDTGWALDISHANVVGRFDFHGASGPLNMDSATIGGSANLKGLKIVATNGLEAIKARSIDVGANFDITRMSVAGGGVQLPSASIRGFLGAGGVTIDCPGKRSLWLTSATIGSSLFLNRGFHSVGRVHLTRTNVLGRVTFEGGIFDQPDPDDFAIVAYGFKADSINTDWQLNGAVDFTDASTRSLDDPNGWGDDYRIQNMSYGFIAPRAVGKLEDRLQWLRGQTNPDTSAYEEFAAYLRRVGRNVDAERVLIERNRSLRQDRQGRYSLVRNSMDWVADVGIGYGYRVGRAVATLLLLLAAVGLILSTPAAQEAMTTVDEDNAIYQASDPCGDGEVRCFEPWFFAVDTVVPLIDLHQRSTWYPNRNHRFGREVEIGLDLAVLLGWALTSAIVIGATHAFGPSRQRGH